jgi:hypothetical protein
VEQVTFGSVSNDSSCEGRDPPSSPPAPAADIDSQVLVASAATPRAGGRYNLRSRVPGASATPSAEGLTKPLLADAAGFEGSGGSDHGLHSHNGHHHHHAHGGSVHGGHAGHVPHHHHSVVTGDLKQGVVLLVAMSVHTFLECMALGLMVRAGGQAAGAVGLVQLGTRDGRCLRSLLQHMLAAHPYLFAHAS